MPNYSASMHRLSLERIAEAARTVDPVFLHSPQFVCEPLGDLLRCDLTLKVETLNPIRSFKGRGADFYLGKLAERDALRPIIAASAGNFGQAMAYACRKRGVALVIYAARNANPLKIERMRALGAEVRLEGEDFDAAKDAARSEAAKSGMAMVEDGLAAEISEGAGSIAVELFEGGRTFDAVLVPLGNGALVNGMGRWIKAVSPATQVIGVCSSGATAMMESWRNGPGGALAVHARTDTIADGIAVRVPVEQAVGDMHGIVDEILAVDDAEILAAMRSLHEHMGLVVEPAGAVGLAAAHGRFNGRRVATVLCGGNLTRSQMRAWLAEPDAHR
ncbi:MAG TPA: pyridoxal-phosphate dependent enzyme [Usitatibacteraceae bacterium]